MILSTSGSVFGDVTLNNTNCGPDNKINVTPSSAPISSTSVMPPSVKSIDTAKPEIRSQILNPPKNPTLIPSGGLMKCWQNGRLIYEKQVNKIPAEVTGVVSIVDGASGQTIQTFDLKNALCVISK